ncbi:hypothetical protein [Phytomonospora endophytica]|uniref:Knr4/Smi1-like domain-containing protein n=1 Tax=Phytomonospora endophytica TaxID=714109 RepID=A0A841G1Y7_9ACTN|nr:hypothetical protein [Phytomonospora endophytica]MBB6038709.1 hypothetical protein [Phytomonospora endophytica]GIG68494.1 hypothetical protein Pen01_47890 [Phytomonospora endophytica]
MRDVRVRLEAMVEGLRDNPRVEVVSARIGDPAGEADLSGVEKSAPADVLDFYREVGSFSLEWRHTVAELAEGDLADQGYVNILPITEVYGDWAGNVWFPGEDETFREVKPFDAFVPEACAAFTDGPHVAYHYYGEELEDTGRTFAEWFELLLVSRGYWYWIQTLCAETVDSHEAEAFRRVMPEVFPDVDLSAFRPRV